MIFFSREQDEVFPHILGGALDFYRDGLREIIEYGDVDRWHAFHPDTARCFTPEVALKTVKQLASVNSVPEHYRITDYHYLLLYDCLNGFCEIFNDIARQEPGGLFEVGPYAFREIDFEDLIEIYFWDTDFLMPYDVVCRLGTAMRESMGLADQVWGISQDLEPHAEELRVTRVDPVVVKDLYRYSEALYRPGSTRYPDPELIEGA